LVEQLRVDQLQAWLEQLGANQQRQDATNDQHGERKQQVQGTDVFVVGGINPALPAMWGTVVVIVTMSVGIEYCAHDVFLLNASFNGRL
jgi:hypothetical protein